MDRLVEDLAKIYSAVCATSWFKIIGNKHPTKEEFRGKVVEFMKHLEDTLAAFPQVPAAVPLKVHARKSLDNVIAIVLAGENKEVEKRYKYDVDYRLDISFSCLNKLLHEPCARSGHLHSSVCVHRLFQPE